MKRDTLKGMIPRISASLFALALAAACEGAPARHAKQISANGDVTLEPSGPALEDSLAQQADSLIRAGRPWRATILLWPSLRTPQSASPDRILAGAHAAAAWEGWSEVERLLNAQSWLDSRFGGEGRALSARALLETGADAVPAARAAFADASDDATRVAREVLLARAFDRANGRDSAAVHYANAAGRLGRISDWLRLRAAGVTADSSSRAAFFAHVTLPVARARVASTEAQARERSAEYAGAAAAYRRAGDELSALRMESLLPPTDASREGLPARILSFLSRSPSASEARQAVDLLDKTGGDVDQLALARAVASTVPARAVAAYAKASATTPLSAADRMSEAGALSRAGKAAEAARVYASITDDPALAPMAAYQHARMQLVAGDGAVARASLRSVATTFARTRAAAAPALLLLADLQVDDNDLGGATQTLHELVTSYPDAPQAPLAQLRGALLAWGASPAVSARELDSLARLHPRDEEALTARYWEARALDKSGQAAQAKVLWQDVIRSAPTSYYAMRAAERLGQPGWRPPSVADSISHIAAVDSAGARIALLRQLGLDVEMRLELDALVDRAARSPVQAAAIARTLSDAGEPARALRVAMAAIERGNASTVLYKLAFPLVHEETVLEESRRNNLDPALVAGLIRQESSWNPRAVSVASARGLMQLLPSVGQAVASAKQYPLWNQVLLFQPDVNLELGTAHLASTLKQDTGKERALAAYNAGASRVTRWSTRPGAEDPELFTEWIPFTETRDYVRIVLRNAAIYRALYGLK